MVEIKNTWIKILDTVHGLEPQKKQDLIECFNTWLDSLKQHNLLLNGLQNLLNDIIRNNGYFNIKTNDAAAFTVGKNLAATPGKIVYKNELIELIKYHPTTDLVYKIPILIIPPCINKYYILDLSAQNSLVKWLVNQGFTVYMISWVNPGAEFSTKEFADYVIHGALTAVNIITKNNSCAQVHAVGYCIGGTILSCMLAYMAQIKDRRIISATNWMSLVDFSNLGDLTIFINKTILSFLETLMKTQGYLDGRLLNMAFNALRPKDLIFPYIINNYLLNKPLPAVDILYWNSDHANLPYSMYNFYLNNICYENLLCKPNGIKINNVFIDLSAITIPIFTLAGFKDHIAPWQAVYNSTKLYGKNKKSQFILASAGHIKGLINPPQDHKYSYKINLINKIFSADHQIDHQEWLNNSIEYTGSWWGLWQQWLININAEKINATQLMQNDLIDAPGTYVFG